MERIWTKTRSSQDVVLLRQLESQRTWIKTFRSRFYERIQTLVQSRPVQSGSCKGLLVSMPGLTSLTLAQISQVVLELLLAGMPSRDTNGLRCDWHRLITPILKITPKGATLERCFGSL